MHRKLYELQFRCTFTLDELVKKVLNALWKKIIWVKMQQVNKKCVPL